MKHKKLKRQIFFEYLWRIYGSNIIFIFESWYIVAELLKLNDLSGNTNFLEYLLVHNMQKSMLFVVQTLL